MFGFGSVFHCHRGALAILGSRPARSKPHGWIRVGFSLSTTYLGDLAFQNHRLQSSSSDGPSRSVRSKETLAILGPRKIAGGTRDHQGFEGFKVPWRSWVHGALPAKPENIIASSQISRLAIFRPDLLDAG